MSHRLDVQKLLVWLSLFSWQGIYQMFGVLGEVIIFREYKFINMKIWLRKSFLQLSILNNSQTTLFLQDAQQSSINDWRFFRNQCYYKKAWISPLEIQNENNKHF